MLDFTITEQMAVMFIPALVALHMALQLICVPICGYVKYITDARDWPDNYYNVLWAKKLLGIPNHTYHEWFSDPVVPVLLPMMVAMLGLFVGLALFKLPPVVTATLIITLISAPLVRMICRTSKKVIAVSKSLDDHKANKNAHN